MASLIRGDWTHRRGDRGGARAVAAEIDRPRPAIAWSWQPEHGGRVDQVRVADTRVLVATMEPGDPSAPGWERGVAYALDAHSGAQIARRVLPDPVPVAAMVVQGETLHVLATRRHEPIRWYALVGADLAPRHRRALSLGGDLDEEDVLDAWATPDGGLWLEIEHYASRARAYAFARADGAPASIHFEDERFPADAPTFAHDACAREDALYVPVQGRWSAPGEAAPPAPPALSKLERREAEAPSSSKSDDAWTRAGVAGPYARMHALVADGAVYGIAAAEDPAKPDRMSVEAFAADPSSGALRWRAHDDRVPLTLEGAGAARAAHRPNGELLFQRLGPDGVPCSPLVCARPDGGIDTILLGARGPYVLDAALGDTVLAHREGKDGRVEVSGFTIDREGLLLGRRAVASWTIETPDLGGETTVYAGAGLIVVRGARCVVGVVL
jgi:hypothetical protein